MVHHFNTAQEADQGIFKDKETSADLKVVGNLGCPCYWSGSPKIIGSLVAHWSLSQTIHRKDLSVVRVMVG